MIGEMLQIFLKLEYSNYLVKSFLNKYGQTYYTT